MNRRLIILAALIAGPAAAAPGGELGTLSVGDYVCELPGDAAGPVGIRVPDADFTVVNASSYSTPAGSGFYLLTGDKVTLTSGPLSGAQYRRQSGGFLRKIEADGSAGKLRCILRVRNNLR